MYGLLFLILVVFGVIGEVWSVETSSVKGSSSLKCSAGKSMLALELMKTNQDYSGWGPDAKFTINLRKSLETRSSKLVSTGKFEGLGTLQAHEVCLPHGAVYSVHVPDAASIATDAGDIGMTVCGQTYLGSGASVLFKHMSDGSCKLLAADFEKQYAGIDTKMDLNFLSSSLLSMPSTTPTGSPNSMPSRAPSQGPSFTPTGTPSKTPKPSSVPTPTPTENPTAKPNGVPTSEPPTSDAPTSEPPTSKAPTADVPTSEAPTVAPSTDKPTDLPTAKPTEVTQPTEQPTPIPTYEVKPYPTAVPTLGGQPSSAPVKNTLPIATFNCGIVLSVTSQAPYDDQTQLAIKQATATSLKTSVDNLDYLGTTFVRKSATRQQPHAKNFNLETTTYSATSNIAVAVASADPAQFYAAAQASLSDTSAFSAALVSACSALGVVNQVSSATVLAPVISSLVVSTFAPTFAPTPKPAILSSMSAGQVAAAAIMSIFGSFCILALIYYYHYYYQPEHSKVPRLDEKEAKEGYFDALTINDNDNEGSALNRDSYGDIGMVQLGGRDSIPDEISLIMNDNDVGAATANTIFHPNSPTPASKYQVVASQNDNERMRL